MNAGIEFGEREQHLIAVASRSPAHSVAMALPRISLPSGAPARFKNLADQHALVDVTVRPSSSLTSTVVRGIAFSSAGVTDSGVRTSPATLSVDAAVARWRGLGADERAAARSTAAHATQDAIGRHAVRVSHASSRQPSQADPRLDVERASRLREPPRQLVVVVAQVLEPEAPRRSRWRWRTAPPD